MFSKALVYNSEHVVLMSEANTEVSELDLAVTKFTSLEILSEFPLLKNQEQSRLKTIKTSDRLDKIHSCLMGKLEQLNCQDHGLLEWLTQNADNSFRFENLQKLTLY